MSGNAGEGYRRENLLEVSGMRGAVLGRVYVVLYSGIRLFMVLRSGIANVWLSTRVSQYS